MKYYCYNEMNDNGELVKVFSEEEILRTFWPYWKERMIEKYGEEDFNNNWGPDDCIDDWIVIHWAWEASEDDIKRWG